MKNFFKRFGLALAVTISIAVFMYYFKDDILKMAEKILPKRSLDPSESFKAEFAKCNPLDLNQTYLISIYDDSNFESCEIAYLQLNLNLHRGESLKLNGKIDKATQSALVRIGDELQMSIETASLDEWLSFV